MKSEKQPTAADYPALRSFVRGYFHQDMKDEYGSAIEATQEFYSDADAEERSAVAGEWKKLVSQMKEAPVAEFNQVFTRVLGSSYSLTTEDIPAITSILEGKKRHS